MVFDHATTTVQVTDNVTHVIFRSEHIHFHDWFKKLRSRFWN
ncbi:Uncharacterised protein [Vibrio cholerae]|nr:Uncharacterised protein [Vibrio cholerae]